MRILVLSWLFQGGSITAVLMQILPLLCRQGSMLLTETIGYLGSNVYLGSCVQLYSLAEAPQAATVPLPPPPHSGSYTRALYGQQIQKTVLRQNVA
jgi:hypothetical protein